jgi:hypothetical protein
MSETANVNVNVIGAGDLQNDLDDALKTTEELNNSAKKTNTTFKNIGQAGAAGFKAIGKAGAAGFKAIGTAIKAAGIGLLIGVLGTLWEAIKQNQTVMDLFSTAVKAVGIIIQPIAEGIGKLVNGIRSGSEEFDAFSKVITNVLKIALKPLQFTIEGVKITVLSLMIAWERLSAKLSKKKELDEGAIAKWQESINESKDRVKELAKETGESFVAIKDNIGEAIQEVKALGEEVIEGVKDAVVEVQNGAARSAALAERNMERLRLTRERLMLTYQNEAELQRQLRDNTELTFEERIKANEELGRILEKQAELEKQSIKDQIAAQQIVLSVNRSNIEAQNELYSLNTQLLEIEERINGQRSEQLTQINALNKEKEEAAKAEIERVRAVNVEINTIEQETEALRKERAIEAETDLQKKVELERELALIKLDQEQTNFEAELEKRLENEEITQEELQSLKEAYQDKYLTSIENVNSAATKSAADAAKAQLEIDKAAQAAKMNGALTVANALLDAADAVFGETKAGAIAATIISTFQSAVNAFNSLSSIPVVGVPLGIAASSAAIISGMAQVSKIKQQDKPSAPSIQKPNLAANKGPLGQFGGMVIGKPHSLGGVQLELEGGEGVVNRSAMAGPDGNIVREINEGKRMSPTFEEVAAMINSQQVYVLESAITTKQKEVSTRESRFVTG